MTQVNQTTEGQITSSADDILPAVSNTSLQENSEESGQPQELDASATAFIDTAIEKVQLDIEDAPFLQDDPDEEEVSATKEGEKATDKTEELAEGEEAKPRNKKKIILIAGAATLLLAILGVAVFFLLDYTGRTAPVMHNFITIPTPPEEMEPAFFEITLEPFWVDLENKGHGAKFLVGKFIIRMDSKDIQKELELNIKKIRDAIYYYLVSVDHEFLINVENREAVRTGIVDIINPYLASGRIENVYFDSFLMR